ncbi:DUF411 domain-containing protein [Terasakiella pusilla]|uniref:DUF411 domain-containing protein n=1 Tax=Terasakiella pusilla TaxID=64973 RepID=UPI003AA95269
MKYVFAFLSLFLLTPDAHAEGEKITVYKSPYCGCCTAWSDHMRENGFDVTEIKRDDMVAVKNQLGVPAKLESCHTASIDGYVIEGHVPASDIRKLLQERPKAAGLSVPGMPMGSPGMEQGAQKDRYVSVLFDKDNMSIFNQH